MKSVSSWESAPDVSLIGRLRGGFRFLACVVLSSWMAARVHIRRRPLSRLQKLGHAARLGRRCVFALGLKVDVVGAPPSGPYVLVANHRSYLDMPLLLAHAPCIFLGKSEIATWPLLGWISRAAGTAHVDRGSIRSGAGALRDLRTALSMGASVAIFPEGTSSPRLTPLPFSSGAFSLASKARVPVVAVAIEYSVKDAGWGSDEPDGSLFQHFVGVMGRRRVGVRLVFRAPRDVDDVKTARDEARTWIAARLGPTVANVGGARE